MKLHIVLETTVHTDLEMKQVVERVAPNAEFKRPASQGKIVGRCPNGDTVTVGVEDLRQSEIIGWLRDSR